MQSLTIWLVRQMYQPCSCLLVVRGAARLFLKPCRSRFGTGLVQKQGPMLPEVHVYKGSDLLETALAQCYSTAFDSVSAVLIYGKSQVRCYKDQTVSKNANFSLLIQKQLKTVLQYHHLIYIKGCVNYLTKYLTYKKGPSKLYLVYSRLPSSEINEHGKVLPYCSLHSFGTHPNFTGHSSLFTQATFQRI